MTTEAEKKLADEKAAADLNEKVSKATSPDEVRDLVVQARDEKGQFTTEKKPAATTAAAATTPEEKKPEENQLFNDTFVIGGKEVEIVGADAADVLRQYKAAMTAYEIAKTPEVKKESAKPAATVEELAALGLRISQGDMKALEEYMEKSGTLDRYLEKKGIKVEEVKKVLDTQATTTIREKWDTEVKAFLAESDWPGGTQNEYILKTKLAQLKDANGQPLAYNPSKENLQRAYEAMKAEGLVFKAEAAANTETPTEQHTTAAERAQAQTTTTSEKKKPTSSSLLGTSGESSTRKVDPKNMAAKLPDITPEMDGRQIMEAFKNCAMANNLNPDDVLRSASKA